MSLVSQPHQTLKVLRSERFVAADKNKLDRGRRKPPPFFYMNDFDMLMKTSRFYEKEAERLLKKLDRSSTKKQKLDALAELKSLKQKIKFEINQISKIIEENEGY